MSSIRNMFVPFGIKQKIIDPDAPRYADVYERCMASIIDVSIIFLLLDWLFSRIYVHLFRDIDAAQLQHIDPQLGIMQALTQLWKLDIIPMMLLNCAIQILVIAPFYIACQIRFGNTPGKMLLGLKIVDQATLQPIAPWRYVLRYAAYITLPAMLIAAFTKRHRALQDVIAGTVVLNMRPKGWYWNHVKRGVHYLCSKALPPSAAVEKPMSEATTEQRHGDGKDAVE